MSNEPATTVLTKEKLPAPKGIKILAGPEDEHAVAQSAVATQDAPFKWHDKELAAFTIDRVGDWLAHRVALNRPDLAVMFDNPLSFLADSLTIIYLCSVEPEEWIGLSSIDLDRAVRKWANDNIAAGEQDAAVILGIAIFTRAHS